MMSLFYIWTSNALVSINIHLINISPSVLEMIVSHIFLPYNRKFWTSQRKNCCCTCCMRSKVQVSQIPKYCKGLWEGWLFMASSKQLQETINIQMYWSFLSSSYYSLKVDLPIDRNRCLYCPPSLTFHNTCIHTDTIRFAYIKTKSCLQKNIKKRKLTEK